MDQLNYLNEIGSIPVVPLVALLTLCGTIGILVTNLVSRFRILKENLTFRHVIIGLTTGVDLEVPENVIECWNIRQARLNCTVAPTLIRNFDPKDWSKVDWVIGSCSIPLPNGIGLNEIERIKLIWYDTYGRRADVKGE